MSKLDSQIAVRKKFKGGLNRVDRMNCFTYGI